MKTKILKLVSLLACGLIAAGMTACGGGSTLPEISSQPQSSSSEMYSSSEEDSNSSDVDSSSEEDSSSSNIDSSSEEDSSSSNIDSSSEEDSSSSEIDSSSEEDSSSSNIDSSSEEDSSSSEIDSSSEEDSSSSDIDSSSEDSSSSEEDSSSSEEPPHEHTWMMVVPGAAATCTNKEEFTIVKCNDCGNYAKRVNSEYILIGETYTEEDRIGEIDENAHAWRSVRPAAITPTCTEPATYQVVKCGYCNAYATVVPNGGTAEYVYIEADFTIEDITAIPALNHMENGVSVLVPATCTEDAYCPLCNASGAALGENAGYLAHHVWADELTVKENPVCGKVTINENYYECVNCDKIRLEFGMITTLNAISYIVRDHDIVPATCTTDAYCEYEDCGASGAELGEDKNLLKHHVWSAENIGKQENCTSAGWLAYYTCVCDCCDDCNAISLDEKTVHGDTTDANGNGIIDCVEIPAKGHAWGEKVEGKAATCTKNGLKSHFQCNDCGRYADSNFNIVEYDSLIIPASHEWIWVEMQMPTCSNDGMLEHYYCENCGSYTDMGGNIVDPASLILPATSHMCTPEGYVPYKEPTCTENGNLAYYICDNDDCDAIIGIVNGEKVVYDSLEELLIPADPTKHSYDNNGICIHCGAEKPVEGTEGVLYRLSDDGTYAEVYDYVGTATEVIIADTYEGRPVTVIADRAFQDCAITDLTFPDTIIFINQYAFYCCGISNITIPSSVVSIGPYAFDNCTHLENVTFVYDSNLTTIHKDAFSSCTVLFSITIPSSVVSIGPYAFQDCRNLRSIIFENNSQLAFIGNDAFNGCRYLENITLPLSISSISKGTFAGCQSLPLIIISQSITSIGDQAFAYCGNLTNIFIPHSVTSIGESVFTNCHRLTNIEVSIDNTNYTSIDGNLYSKDKTTLIQYALGKVDSSFIIPNSVISIKAQAFISNWNLAHITIPNSVTSIGMWAFSNCRSLNEINFTGTIQQWISIQKDTDWNYYVPAKVVICSDGVTCITKHTLEYVAGTQPTCITDGYQEHYRCSVCENVFLDSAGANLVDKATLTIPADPASHNYNESGVCIYCGDSKEIAGTEGVLYRLSSDGTYAVVYDYIGTATEVVIANTYEGKPVTQINNYALDHKNLKIVTIPNSVTSIGDRAFERCIYLTSITIGDSVTSIGDYAFQDCDSLKIVTIPNSVTSIGDYAFYSCDSLTNVTIPDSVTSIGRRAFTASSFNESGSLQYNEKDGLKYLGNDNNPYLYLLSTTTTLILTVAIDENCRFINDYAFFGCYGITSITIPDSVISIGDYAFEDCSNLTEIHFEGTIEQWNAITKGSNWNYNVPATKVICKDGEVAI